MGLFSGWDIWDARLSAQQTARQHSLLADLRSFSTSIVALFQLFSEFLNAFRLVWDEPPLPCPIWESADYQRANAAPLLSRRIRCAHPGTLAISAWSGSRPTLERFAECGLRFIADSAGDFGEAFRARAQHPGSLVHSSACEVLQGRLTHQFPKIGRRHPRTTTPDCITLRNDFRSAAGTRSSPCPTPNSSSPNHVRTASSTRDSLRLIGCGSV